MGLLGKFLKIAATAAFLVTPLMTTSVLADQHEGGGGPGPGPGPGFANQTDFKIMMNYELGMHCTGFEFAYCCVLPAYNSILAQVVKPEGADRADFPELLEGDPNNGVDALGRQTVLRDKALDRDRNFKKYVLKYWHDAQPRVDRGKPQVSTLISAVEGNSLLSWNTTFDSAALNPDGSFVLSGEDGNPLYNGAEGVMLGNGLPDPSDNYQNAVWNHLYFYEDLEGSNSTGTSLEDDKIRLGVSRQTNPPGLPSDIAYPIDCGPAFHPMGPVTSNGQPIGNDPDSDLLTENTCGGFSNGNVLTFSGEHGTIVYTQMKVLENLPVMLTSPDIWEALGLPLTPFEDTIDFFGDPGLVDEDSIRPFVAMKAQMYHWDDGAANRAVLDQRGDPVIGFGTAPIDIPNCERCHSNGINGSEIQNSDDEGGGTLIVDNSPNDPEFSQPGQLAAVQQEYAFWNAYYDIDTGAGDSDWYSRLKSAAISMLWAHDDNHGTGFTDNYPGCGSPNDPTDTTGCGALPQNTRLGHESVICQRCHADNVIAAVKSATSGGVLIPPVTEAIHNNHRSVSTGGPILFADAEGRDGACQGCHPAHRSDGDMAGYPITLAGTNFYADSDNRDASGGCFVGRDVHSNPGKDDDGTETPEHLNAVGQWLSDNVYSEQGPNGDKGIWCTNCHQQLGQEMWKAENCTDLINGDCITDIRGLNTLDEIAAAVGVSPDQAKSWLDPADPNVNPGWVTDPGAERLSDTTHDIWNSNPGLCNYVAGYFDVIPVDPSHDGNVATVEVNVTSAEACSTGGGTGLIDCGAEYPGAPAFHICGSTDGDGDFSVSLLDFCTTDDCVTAAQAALPAGSVAVPVPFSAATDGRDHWLSAGEPHCADCHAAPYTEGTGDTDPYPPFNYPRKASLMRYSRGHQDISCQGCHESIHGLYPVTPTIDTTSYAQAAALNHDGSHGPLKCGTCHEVRDNGVPRWVDDLEYNGQRVRGNFDRAVSWMHTYTIEADPTEDVCLNCHGDEVDEVSWNEEEWTEHTMKGRTSRQTMDRVEADLGVTIPQDGDPRNLRRTLNTLCESCHSDESDEVSCTGSDGREWKEHLTEGRVSVEVWENVSTQLIGDTCGW